MSEPDDLDRPLPQFVMTRGLADPARSPIRPETLLLVEGPPGGPDAEHGGRGPLGRASGRTAVPGGAPEDGAREHLAVLTLCRQMLSVAEVAAHLELPPSVVTVVAGNLADEGLMTVREPARIDMETLEEVLNGLREL